MAKVVKSDKPHQVLVVFLGSQVFGVPIMKIQDVLGPQQVTYVPLAPASVRGVMNLRGRIVTVIDLRSSINAAEKPRESADYMSVVIENDGELYSLVVDRVGDVMTLDPSMIEAPPLTMNPAWKRVASGVYQLKDRIMVILDAPAVLSGAHA